jgi:hypothetical protein
VIEVHCVDVVVLVELWLGISRIVSGCIAVAEDKLEQLVHQRATIGEKR